MNDERTDPGWEGLDRQSLAARVLALLNSREWWLLVPLGENGNSVIQKIERTYYYGEANEDFVLIMDSNAPFWAFYLAKKSRMSGEALVSHFPGPPVAKETLLESLRERDLLLLGAELGPSGVAEANAFIQWFSETMGFGV